MFKKFSGSHQLCSMVSLRQSYYYFVN